MLILNYLLPQLNWIALQCKRTHFKILTNVFAIKKTHVVPEKKKKKNTDISLGGFNLESLTRAMLNVGINASQLWHWTK